MKEFNTITEKEILELAYRGLVDKIDCELAFNRDYYNKYGKANENAITRYIKYQAQADEISDRIIDLELAEQAQQCVKM